MIKVYEIRGIVESSRAFTIANKTIRCTFSGGSISESGIVPATCTTDDFVEQSIIEASKDYKDGFIKLGSKFGADVEDEEPEDASDFPEVNNTQKAKTVLMNEPYNASLAELSNKAQIMAKAAELGVTFSNWN